MDETRALDIRNRIMVPSWHCPRTRQAREQALLVGDEQGAGMTSSVPEEGASVGPGVRPVPAGALVGYFGGPVAARLQVRPAARKRDWLDIGKARAGKHCLPL